MSVKLLSAYVIGALLMAWTIAAIFGLGAIVLLAL